MHQTQHLCFKATFSIVKKIQRKIFLLPPRELLPSTVRNTEAVTGRTRMGSKRLREDGTEMETGEDTEEEEEFRSPGRSPVRKK